MNTIITVAMTIIVSMNCATSTLGMKPVDHSVVATTMVETVTPRFTQRDIAEAVYNIGVALRDM